jgi:hypothetical protein
MTHFPPLNGLDENMAGILRRVLADPGLPERYRDPASWPEPLRREWGSDGGKAAGAAHRETLVAQSVGNSSTLRRRAPRPCPVPVT